MTELTSYDSDQSDVPPAAGYWKLAADDTLSDLIGTPTSDPPSLSTSASQNSATFDWGTFDQIDATGRVARVLFTLTATDEPMADALSLANLALQQSQNSLGEPQVAQVCSTTWLPGSRSSPSPRELPQQAAAEPSTRFQSCCQLTATLTGRTRTTR